MKEVQHKVPQKKGKKKKEERRYRSSSRLFSASKKPQVSHPALPARPNKGYRELKGHKVKNSLSQGVLRLSELPDVACKYLQRSFFSKKPLRECSQKERGWISLSSLFSPSPRHNSSDDLLHWRYCSTLIWLQLGAGSPLALFIAA